MLKWLLGIGLLACIWSAPAEAACAGGTCFVVAAGGNSATNTTWTLTSGGSSCACLPTTTDAVILDSLAGNLTVNGALSIGTLDASGTGGSGSPYTGILADAASTITINTGAANSLKFSSQMTFTAGNSASSIVTFANTSGTAQITSNGKVFSVINMNGVGGTAQQLDDISINKQTAANTGTLVVTNGTWDANGFAITANAISITGSNARGFLMGGLVKIGGGIVTGTNVWNAATTTLLTFTKNSANIEIISPTTAIQTQNFAGGALTYNSLTVDNNSNATNVNLAMSGANGWANITIGSGWNFTPTAGLTQTLSGTFTVTGTSTAPDLLYTSATETISAPTCSLTWASVSGFTFTGGCAPTITNGFNFGTTSGATFTSPSGGGGYIIGN